MNRTAKNLTIKLSGEVSKTREDALKEASIFMRITQEKNSEVLGDSLKFENGELWCLVDFKMLNGYYTYLEFTKNS